TAIPANATHALGETHTVTATLVNVATALPIANDTLYFQVTEGPNAGLTSQTRTDANGKAAFSYVGTITGTDTIIVHTPYGTIKQTGTKVPAPASITDCTAWDTTAEAVHVTWEGGPDLTVPLFVPPMLISSPGNTFYITEETRNNGNLPAGSSVTRYYIATSEPLDPSTAILVGQRSVPTLAPGEVSTVTEVPFTVPAALPAGTYYLDACADADNQVVETNESNNCASSSLQLVAAIMPQDQPPDCSKAQASPDILWPPDHKLVPIAITGVTDPDGDPVTLSVTGITQDEPLNGLGDGDTCPDGFGVGRNQPQVRAERSGLGNGRVYKIAFTASDGKGGTCTGTVTAGVPHDRKDTPADDGQKYDSTKCPR
ncbi:MAG: CARDB domain-containing protein, partial [Thermoanaerobaculaceae bacterium]